MRTSRSNCAPCVNNSLGGFVGGTSFLWGGVGTKLNLLSVGACLRRPFSFMLASTKKTVNACTSRFALVLGIQIRVTGSKVRQFVVSRVSINVVNDFIAKMAVDVHPDQSVGQIKPPVYPDHFVSVFSSAPSIVPNASAFRGSDLSCNRPSFSVVIEKINKSLLGRCAHCHALLHEVGSPRVVTYV